MTKRIVAGVIILAIAVFFFTRKEKAPFVTSAPDQTLVPPNKSSVPPLPAKIQKARKPASTGYVNSPSKDWEKLLTASLKAQGGNTLKDIKIEKEREIVWRRDETPLHVQSVKITMTNTKNVQSSFKALVDSQTGKVIETWDQSIFDPANVREGFRFKLDPRYSN